MSRKLTPFFGSGPVGLPPVTWNEKTIEREEVRGKDLSDPRYENWIENFNLYIILMICL
jgi:hypothetical protein